MSRLDLALRRLAEGCFVCAVHYPEEYAALQEADGRARAEAWLSAIGYRLARLDAEGAFFMAHAVVTAELRNRLRDELRTVRSRLEPVVGFMETLRQAQGRHPQIHAGDMLWESEISEAVRGSALLERRLLEMREIGGARVTGKIDYLYQLIGFIAENTTHLSDDAVTDQLGAQSRLDGVPTGGGAAFSAQAAEDADAVTATDSVVNASKGGDAAT